MTLVSRRRSLRLVFIVAHCCLSLSNTGNSVACCSRNVRLGRCPSSICPAIWRRRPHTDTVPIPSNYIGMHSHTDIHTHTHWSLIITFFKFFNLDLIIQSTKGLNETLWCNSAIVIFSLIRSVCHCDQPSFAHRCLVVAWWEGWKHEWGQERGAPAGDGRHVIRTIGKLFDWDLNTLTKYFLNFYCVLFSVVNHPIILSETYKNNLLAQSYHSTNTEILTLLV